MKTIPLSQGRVALVDNADYERLNHFKWYAFPNHHSHTFYAVRQIPAGKYKQKHEQMHRVILGLRRNDDRQCDHIDGDGLNNVQSNLRICTSTQNSQSRRKRKVGTSKYKGVHWHRRHSKWQSSVRVKKILIHLGYYPTPEDAARAYDIAALEHFGEFALTNEMLGLL